MTQLALVMETRNMAVSHAVSAQKREKTPRTAWDAVTPYKWWVTPNPMYGEEQAS